MQITFRSAQELRAPAFLWLSMLVVPALAVTGKIQNFDSPGSAFTTVGGINASGQVVGYSTNRDTAGFIRNAAGSFTIISDPAGSNETFGMAINDAGVVAGGYIDNSAVLHAFMRDTAGNLTTIDPTSDNNGLALSINSSGEIAGTYSCLSCGTTNAFIRDASGNFTTFVPRNAMKVDNVVINKSGAAAGSWSDAMQYEHGFYRSVAGTLTTFDAPTATLTSVIAINDSGILVGSVQEPSGSHALYRSAAGVITTFDVPGAQETFALGINASGVVTGYYVSSGLVLHGYTRDAQGKLVKFDDALGGSKGFEGTFPVAINASGVIAGNVTDAKRVQHGFVRN